MATHRRKPNRPSIKSKVKKLPLGKLDWSNSDRNTSTLKRISKAIDEENDISGDALDGYGTIQNWEKHNGRGFWGNETTGYIYNDDLNNI